MALPLMALPLMARGRHGGRAPLAVPGVGQAPPPPGMPAQRRANPQPQPSPGRPGEQSGGRDGLGPAPGRLMREDEIRRREGGRKEQRRRHPLIPQEKLVCARPPGYCPPARATQSHLSRPPRRGPLGPARSRALRTVAPTAPLSPFLLLLFQGRLGASRRKSRPSPVPPAGSGAEGPSRPRNRAVSQRLRPRPYPRQAPPPSLFCGAEKLAGQRMRPGAAEAVGVGWGGELASLSSSCGAGATWGSSLGRKVCDWVGQWT